MDGKEEESAVVVEPAFQNDGVPVGVGPKEITEGLKCNRRCRFQKGRSCSQAVELPDEAEDQRGDGGEELLIMSEINPKGFRDGENELSVRKLEEELFVEIFGEQEGALLGA